MTHGVEMCDPVECPAVLVTRRDDNTTPYECQVNCIYEKYDNQYI